MAPMPIAMSDMPPFIQYTQAKAKKEPYATGASNKNKVDLFLKQKPMTAQITMSDKPMVSSKSFFI